MVLKELPDKFLETYYKDRKDNPSKLRWYNLTIPGIGPPMYLAANFDNPNFSNVGKFLVSAVTSTILVPSTIILGIKYLVR